MYTQFVQVFVLEKYNVEERVDGEIRRVTGEVRRAVWNVVQDAGWCAVAQVGDVVGLVMALMPAREEEERSDGGEECEDNCDDDGVVVVDEDDKDKGKDEHDDGISEGVEEDEDYGISFEGETSESEPYHKMQEILQNTDARRSASDQESGIEPVSSFASLSSIRSSFGMYEEDGTLLDDDVDASYSGDNHTQSVSEVYLRDLTQMLRIGLYVYASLGGGDDGTTNTDRPFRLSLFSYHPAASPTATEPATSSDTTKNVDCKTTSPLHNCFVFTPPPTTANESHDGERMVNDSVILPLDDVVRVQKTGTHSIEIRTVSQRRPLELWPALGKSLVEGTLERARSVGSDVSEKDFVELMKNWSDGGNNSQGILAEEKEEQGDFVFAEMVLLDGEDRDTLFVGLRTLLKTFDRHGDFDNSATEKEKKNTKFKENVKAMESDVIPEKWACEMGKVEDTESKKEISSANALDESSIVSTPRKERLSDGDNEDITCNLRKALGNGTSDHESFFFGELLMGGMAGSSPRQQK